MSTLGRGVQKTAATYVKEETMCKMKCEISMCNSAWAQRKRKALQTHLALILLEQVPDLFQVVVGSGEGSCSCAGRYT
jgi:RAB protein geranylgeranyltransferase component A